MDGIGGKILWPNGLRGTADKNKPDFETQVIRSAGAPLILYDVKSERGWLVSELSAALHISIARLLKRRLDEGVAIPFASPLADGGEAAKKVILDIGDIVMQKAAF